MELIRKYFKGMAVFKNSEGFLEGYKPKGKGKRPEWEDDKGYAVNADSVERIVSNARTIEEFDKFLEGRKVKRKRIKEDKGQELPFGE